MSPEERKAPLGVGSETVDGHEVFEAINWNKIVVGKENTTYFTSKVLSDPSDASQNFGLITRSKSLLRRGIHFTKGTFVPRTPICNGQNERLRFAGRAKYGFKVADVHSRQHSSSGTP